MPKPDGVNGNDHSPHAAVEQHGCNAARGEEARFGLLLIAIEAVWSRPHKEEKRGHGTSWSLTVYFLLLWSL
ncbi:hypothetical protein ACC704_38075, partial [Rhizobium johnstonii]|uniref:hypothetical protein n=1 Tax=Rhizobium johnstonii TaxID=3019933 RepID=UPI003F963F9F